MNMLEKPEVLLECGQKQLGLDIPQQRLQIMLQYLSLLAKWNQTHNLTAITGRAEMVVHHLLDCLSVYHFIKGGRVLDIGTGAGLPGVPLAIANPEIEITLLDGRGKKIEFLRYVKSQLAVKNIFPVNSRIENYQPAEKFDTLTTRAVATVPDLLSLTGAIFTTDSRFIFMQGSKQGLSGTELNADYKVSTVKISVPYLDAQRHIVIIEN